MRREDRQQAIMDLLVADGAVDVEELSARYAVSRMTVHRDLDDLEQAGLLRKVRGGATIESGTQFESDFRFRERQGVRAKAAIANAAMQLVEPGMTVLINDGSTAAVLGRSLPRRRPLTVISNNAAVVDELKGVGGVTLIALGGVYSPKFNAFFGKVTEDSLAGLRADIAFISAPAVMGLDVFHMDDDAVRAKRAMMTAAKRKCLLVNHMRFGHGALHKLAELHEFDVVVTDHQPDPLACNALVRSGLELTVAPDEANDT